MDLSINEGTLVVTGGSGDSPANAIVIKKTPKGLSAAGAEYLFLTQRYGELERPAVTRPVQAGLRNQTWTLRHQDFIALGGRLFDTFDIVLDDGSERTVYFDVTDWLSRIRHTL